jgi:hypothetical protein
VSGGIGWRGILGETVRNLFGRRARSAILLAILVAGAYTTFVEAYLSARSARAEQASLVLQGLNIVTLSGDKIPGVNCERLTEIAGVVSAGAIAPAGSVVVRPGDLSIYTSYNATAGFVTVMADQVPAPPPGGWYVGQDVAGELGIGASSSRTVYPLNGSAANSSASELVPVRYGLRGEYYQRSMIRLTSPTAVFSECYVALIGPVSESAPQTLAARLNAGSAIQAGWLIDRKKLGLSPVDSYENRAARWAWVALALLVGAVGALICRSRGVEFALYRTNGATLTTLLAIVVPEYWILAIVAAASWAVPLAAIEVLSTSAIDWAAVTVALIQLGAFLAAALAALALATAASVRGSPWELLRRE